MLLSAKEANMLEHTPFDADDDDVDISALPKLTVLNGSEVDYFLRIVISADNILLKKSTLDSETNLLGQGNFFWPKNPAKPTELIKLYRDFQIHGMWMRFERVSKSQSWTKASLIITPRNFPDGCYQIKLGQSFWSNLNLKDISVREYAEQNPRKIRIYRYVLANNSKIQYEFFEDAELNQANDFPDKFFSINLSKLPD